MINLEQTLDHELEQMPVTVPVWAWLLVALAVLAVYAVAMENGAVLKSGASTLHELFHDGRHMLGVPCH